MDFGQALGVLERGGTVSRSGWNGKGMWLWRCVPSDPSWLPFIVMVTADGRNVPWLASQTDVQAQDWEPGGEHVPAFILGASFFTEAERAAMRMLLSRACRAEHEDLIGAIMKNMNLDGLGGDRGLLEFIDKITRLIGPNPPDWMATAGARTPPPRGAAASPIDCVHANEAPSVCPCPPGCYCATRTCAPKTRTKRHPQARAHRFNALRDAAYRLRDPQVARVVADLVNYVGEIEDDVGLLKAGEET